MVIIPLDYFKVALPFTISYIPNNNSFRNNHTYIIINVSYEGICVQFERRKHPTLVFLLSSCPQTLNYFMTDPSNIILDDFGV